MNKVELPEEIALRFPSVFSALSCILYTNKDSKKEEVMMQEFTSRLRLVRPEIENLIT